MTTGERIRFFRQQRGMTQKELGMAVGFEEKGADKRIAQYETNYRVPKRELLDNIAQALEVAPAALTAPDVSVPAVLMHTLFALEDECGVSPAFDQWHDGFYLSVEEQKKLSPYFLSLLAKWLDMKEKVDKGEIAKEEYDRWRYNWPKG